MALSPSPTHQYGPVAKVTHAIVVVNCVFASINICHIGSLDGCVASKSEALDIQQELTFKWEKASRGKIDSNVFCSNLNVQLGHWTFKYEQNTFEINGVSRPPPWGNPRRVAISSTPINS